VCSSDLFDIVGPEKPIDLSTWTQQGSSQFFVSERDEYSSGRIKQLLENDPDAKALIYYGGAHLEKEKVAKLGRNQGWGYYMAHYLSEHFASKGGLYTCGQLPLKSVTWLDPALAKIGKTFALDNVFLKGAAIVAGASFIQVDGVVYHDALPQPGRHISTVFSENLVDLALNHLDEYSDSTKQYYKNIFYWSMRYLSSQAARDWTPERLGTGHGIDSAIKSWKDWRKSTSLRFVEEITDLSLFKRLIDRMNTTDQRQSTQYRDVIAQLTGFTVWFPAGATAQEQTDSLWKSLNRYRKPVVVENLIHLLWVGSQSEIQKALAVLRKETGEDFNSARQWTTWWESRL
jgi:hypothetical protein